MTTAEKIQFQAEIKQLLDLMIHSLYTHREIFLRELISNASDALDKRRYEAITRHELAPENDDYRIDISTDREARTVVIADNGIGMNRDELIHNIGTIARSGSKSFLQQLRDAKEGAAGGTLPPELIGQFGVGFYASFMVADKVELVTRRVGDERAWRWESLGDGSYTIEEATRSEAGTTITLHLKPAGEDETDYSNERELNGIIKKYSDFITYPIRLESPGSKDKSQPVNAMKPLWARQAKEVTQQEYSEFYRHVSHAWGDPLKAIHFSVEGTLEYQAILFIPEEAPFELFMPERKHGIHLYARRVFIMENCEELLPPYLRFVKGVVDCADISLNVSREMIQQNQQVALIRKRLVKKVLDTLDEMLEKDRELYVRFWRSFGSVLKEGLYADEQNRERLQKLVLFGTTRSESDLSTFDEYVGRMTDGQKAIYFLSGESREELRASPHLEAVTARGYEVILFTDPIDELMLERIETHGDLPVKSIARGDLDLGESDEKKRDKEERSKELSGLIEYLKDQLKDHVKEVRVSTRLTTSPVCLVTDDHAMAPHIEKILARQGQNVPKQRRILEINAEHPLVRKAFAMFERERGSDGLRNYAFLLYGLGALAEGVPLPDAGRFTALVAALMAESSG